MKKKLSILLALMLVAVSLLTVTAMAVDGEENAPVARIGDDTYTTLEEALNAAEESKLGSVTIQVLQSYEITESIIIPEGKTFIITADADAQITITDTGRYGIKANGSLTMENITFSTNGQIALNGTTAGGPFGREIIFRNATLNMDGEMHEFHSNGYYCCAIFADNPALLVFDGSEVVIKNYPLTGSAIRWNGKLGDSGYGVEIINGTTFESTNCYAGFTGTLDILVENSDVCVHDHRGNGSNGSHVVIRSDQNLTADDEEYTVVNFSDNGSHGLSTGTLEIDNATVIANGNGGNGVHTSSSLTIKNNSIVSIQNNDCSISSQWSIPGALHIGNDSSTIDSTSTVTITNNSGSGILQKDGSLTVEAGAKLTITNNKAEKLGYGGGINNRGTIILPENVVLYNNHASTAGDDIYCESGASLTFGQTGTNWYLDGDTDCYHRIDGWYDDSNGSRWEAHEDNPQDNHVVEFDEFGQDTGLATVSGVTALKAAHGLLGADEDTVVINPADITIYTGGDGYDSVVSGVGGSGVASDGLPTAGYLITLPDWVDALYFNGASEAADLSGSVRFVLDYEGDGEYNTANDRIWELERYSDSGTSTTSDEIARYVYRMDTDKVNGVPVRLQFEDEDGDITISDDFTIGLDNLYQSYEMTIYPGNLETDSIKAQIIVGGDVVQTLNVEVGTANLTIRGTTNAEVTTGVVNDESDVADTTQAVSDGTGCTVTAVAPENTAYYINNSLVSVDPDNVSLLTDAVVDTAVLQDYIIENDIAGSGDNYVYRYLDLVDSTNGRTWITAKNPIAVYWKLPNGTDGTEDFRIVHFQGLDREYDNHDEQLAENEPEVYSIGSGLEVVEIGGEKYLKFTVNSFSPFVLVWSDEGGGWNPPDIDDDKPEKPGGLNTEDHVAYIIGYPDGEVKPEGNITRAEVATIFFRLLTDETRDEYWSKTNSYTDVPADSWFNNAISTLSNMGIIDGYADGSFRPDAPITRAEFTKIAVSFFEYADYVYENTFTDVRSGSWYTQFIAAAVEIGLIEGYPDGTFRPDNYITRAEACTIVNRTLNRAPDEDHLLPESVMITWPDNQPGTWYYADMQEATNSHDYDWLGSIEDWTEKLEERDWEALEKLWSDSHDAPGGEVMG